MNVIDRVMEIVSLQIGCKVESLHTSDSIRTVHGVDSLDEIEIIMGLESEFDINIDEEITEKHDVTIADLIQIVESKVK